jgi:hypothetical protein
MKLTAKALQNVDSVNAFKYSSQVEGFEGQPNDLYFQLFDEHRGLRYIPASGSSLKVTFQNVDTSLNYDKVATNPFADDRSIFKISLASTETFSTGGLKFVLTEGGIDKPFYVMSITVFNSTSVGGC